MNKLVLHVGPGKCGSSTIQEFFIANEKPCAEKLNFIFLDANEILKLSSIDPSEDSTEYFTSLIRNSIETNEVTILSHEFLFSKRHAIKHICSIAKHLVDEILIIGYSRKQSGFTVSSYSQWFFRSPERISEANKGLIAMGLDPIYFSGLERHLIASISNDFYTARQMSDDSILNWNNSYGEVEQLTAPFGVKIRCGNLPQRDAPKNLIEDFCEKAGLTITAECKDLTNVTSNVKFNGDLIEAISVATEQGLVAPNPHLDNEFLSEVSKDITSASFTDEAFLSILKQYIDSYYLESNLEFSEKYDLDKGFFEVNKKVSKVEIIELIKNEQSKRAQNNLIINRYKELTGIMGELLFKLHKDQPPIQNTSFLKRIKSNFFVERSYKKIMQSVLPERSK